MIALSAALAAAAATGVPSGRIDRIEQLPEELRPFVEDGSRPIWVSAADLDRDGDSDFILVLEFSIESAPRSLLVVAREADGRFRIAARGDHAVMCGECGTGGGDPFVEVEAARGSFEVRHYGGDAWRWGNGYRFGYSRRDSTWQLVEASTLEFNALEWKGPESEHEQRFVPPKDFGKIDLADFDSEDWQGRGKR